MNQHDVEGAIGKRQHRRVGNYGRDVDSKSLSANSGAQGGAERDVRRDDPGTAER
jgi:hypothetical protein